NGRDPPGRSAAGLAELMSLPLALVGAFGALALSRSAFTLFSLLGVAMLVGIVGKNAILLVDYTDTLRKRGLGRTEALLEAGPTRLRPIAMTTFARPSSASCTRATAPRRSPTGSSAASFPRW